MNFTSRDRSGSPSCVSISRISGESARELVLREFAAESLKTCLVDPIGGVDLYAQEWMNDEYIEGLRSDIKKATLESFDVKDEDSGNSTLIVSSEVSTKKILEFIFQVWTTQPIFRCFFNGMKMAWLHSRLSPADSQEFFCANPCDYDTIGLRLSIPRDGWILVFDQYSEADDYLRIESAS